MRHVPYTSNRTVHGAVMTPHSSYNRACGPVEFAFDVGRALRGLGNGVGFVYPRHLDGHE